MKNQESAAVSRCSALAHSTRQLALWTGGWLATTALMTFGARHLWAGSEAFSLLSILLNLAVGAGMILAVVRHLRAQDEMERKLFLDAAAVTLGAGLVAGTAWQFYGKLAFVSLEPQISHLIMLMGLTFLLSLVVGHRRLQ
ncbi:hypothetical protein [Microbulbifer yueqingensis]|uniref:Uncharacterized protein n=1 Tax=Microbulbifer yueqingensis TaxID=658219 RepID=A0A1G8W0W4_9GAMM|nr:hypothetical protein [Microbulbifer yueqingensis]SDJ71365.1 hypothetical protein SAMN05216212_0799 [Microbulbifer yueqingensis]